MPNTDNDLFIKVTHRDVYNEVQDIKRILQQDIIRRLDYTNGKVKLNRWIATTALMLVIIVIGWVVIV